jgi:hypothetical protein
VQAVDRGGGMNAPLEPSAAKSAFDARWQRIMDCVNLKQPDRMPVVLYGTFWLAKYGGMSYRDLMFDYDRNQEVCQRALLEFDPDVTGPLVLITAMGRALEAIDFKQLQWPGHGVGDNQPYQYLDREYMKADEYDDLLLDPTGFYLRKYLPRVAGVFEGFDQIPSFPGLHYFRLINGIRPFALPEVKASFERIVKAAEEAERFFQQHVKFVKHATAHGYPLINGTTSATPYDLVADYFRGATGMMKDLYRHKDKVHALLDKARTFLLSQSIAAAKGAAHPIVFIPIHWGADAFMSEKHFREFWWPPFRELMVGMIDAGLIPMPLWESDCTKRLEIIKDVPPGKCIYWFERTDMVKAFEVLGDVVALRGNLSASLLATGAPAEVDAAVKHLVDKVWNKGGNLILDSSFGLPDETPVENVRAMFNAARKYAG